MKLSFRMQILLPVIITLAISFIATGFILYQTFYKNIDQMARSDAWNLSYRYANLVRGELNAAMNFADAVGEVALLLADDPMVEEHYIEWVYIQTQKGGQRKALDKGAVPSLKFKLLTKI